MTSPTRRSAALRFWVASAMNKSRSVIIPITRPLRSITGREPQPLFHIFSPAAAAFVPGEQEDTSFVIISLTCMVLLLLAAFVAQRADWQLSSKQKATKKGSGSLNDPSLYRAPVPSCALG